MNHPHETPASAARAASAPDSARQLLRHAVGDRSGPLSRLLVERALSVVFQPIVNLGSGAIHAHEALIRGPKGMPLQSPEALFAAARREGLTLDFEIACIVQALERWVQLQRPGRLFVNISASALIQCFRGHGAEAIARCITAFGMAPGQLVFEITEHEHANDIPALVQVAEQVHEAGMRFALDDFGDGRSSLRLWSELGPDFVKIDKYFTREIAGHARQLKTLRALMQIAETFGSTLVAEGVETGDDLRVLRDLGVPMAQGYLLGRPAPLPRAEPEDVAASVLADSRVAVMPSLRLAVSPARLGQLPLIPADAVTPDTSNEAVAEIFHRHPEWHALAVVDEAERPVALIGRQQFLDRYARPYFKELYGRKPCMAFANTAPTLVECDADIDLLVAVLTSPDQRYLSEGYVFVDNGLYRGLGTGHQLVRRVTESRVEAARHANPLTLLPGNIPISEHIERMLRARTEFVAAYADLADFKPFNDYYGYWRGDEVIKLLARTLQAHCDPRRDFVGHVGGDDFVVLFQSSDWEPRCEAMLATFAEKARELYDDDARQVGGIRIDDRHGVQRFFGFTTLYMGVVPVGPASGLQSAAEVASAAARAKQAAKSGRLPMFVAGSPLGTASAHAPFGPVGAARPAGSVSPEPASRSR